MSLQKSLDSRIDKTKLDCSKCPISREDCLKIIEVIKEKEGSYSVKSDCLLKIIIRDTARFFHTGK